MLSYCLVCKKTTDNASIIKDGRLKIKSLCTVCGNKNVRHVNRWSSSLDSLLINYKNEKK